MKEYIIRFALPGGNGCLIILRSWWSLLLWILTTSWRCAYLSLDYIAPADYEPIEEEWPCETCLRWEECNGVDRDNCPRF